MVVLSFQALQSPISVDHCYSPPIFRSSSSTFTITRCGIAEASGQPAPLGVKTKYNDGLFEKVFMSLFARKMEKFAAGGDNKDKGLFDYDYESFVEVSKRVMLGRSRIQQQQVVREVLLSMLPPGAPAQVYIHSSICLSLGELFCFCFINFGYESRAWRVK